MEFLAEQELIAIVPHFHVRENNGMMNFIGGDFGPFQAGITTQVPLWLAIMLKQLNKCRIITPSWLAVDFLTARLEREKQSDVFEKLPYHYLEFASLLFKNAPEDVEQIEHVRSLLEDLQNVRQDKIRNGLYKISTDVQNGGTAYAIQMNNIAGLEINSVRQFMIGVSDLANACLGCRWSLNKFHGLAKLSEEQSANDDFTQSQSQMFSEPSSAEATPVQRLRRFR
ncbi:TPA: hypothetical protein N0F65_006483 [Lagenidium giganteum]|uniref:DNA replication complex GINS protein PSF2 n=1 Tax=Lagenidium giganteum TaxID=4803 RepID=A0AAV2YP53_9STRA|nr:TPA: hypothetical protein N0F65_006483 [Lagenidium giganteum]